MKESPKSNVGKLPDKSEPIAAGALCGEDYIYIMDKPVGIESGAMLLRKDDPNYREYIKKHLEEIRIIQNQRVLGRDPPVTPLQEKVLLLIDADPNWMQLSSEEQVDYVISQQFLIENRPKKHLTTVRDRLALEGQLQETIVKKTYTNIGLSGLFFEGYKESLGIKKDEHGKDMPWHEQLKRFGAQEGSIVYMVKQDYDIDANGKPYKPLNNFMRTSAVKRIFDKFGYRAALWYSKAWRLGDKYTKDRISVNASSMVETFVTQVSAKRGFYSQEIDLIPGTIKNSNKHKVAMRVKWDSHFTDLNGRLKGSRDLKGKASYNNYLCDWEEQGDRKGIKLKKVNGKYVSASHRIRNLGEGLIAIIASGDRDGVGKKGGNRGLVPNGDGTYRLMAIDYGKAYNLDNRAKASHEKILSSLNDDFTFDNSKKSQERIVNVSIYYDTTLSDKMKGVYLIAASRGKPADLDIEQVAKNYEKSDPEFAKKLRCIEINADIKLISDQLIALNKKYEANPTDPEYLRYYKELIDLNATILERDYKILEVFENRLKLSPDQLNMLENFERLTSSHLQATSEDGHVMLNHIQVQRKYRIPWKLMPNAESNNMNEDDKTFTLSCTIPQNTKFKMKALMEMMKEFRAVIPGIELTATLDKNGNVNGYAFKNLKKADLDKIQGLLTEPKIAEIRRLNYKNVDYRKNAAFLSPDTTQGNPTKTKDSNEVYFKKPITFMKNMLGKLKASENLDSSDEKKRKNSKFSV